MPYLPASFGYVLRFVHILHTFSSATPPTPPSENHYTCFSLFKYKVIIKFAHSSHPCPFWPLSFCILMHFFKATRSPTCSVTCPLMPSDFFKLCWPLVQKAHSTVLISLLDPASAVIWNPQKYFFFLDFNTYWVLSVRHCPRLCVSKCEGERGPCPQET